METSGNFRTVALQTPKTAILIKQKHYQQALTVAQQVDKANPTLAIGKILKGDVSLSQQKLPEALSHYQRAYVIKSNIKYQSTGCHTEDISPAKTT